MALEQETEAIVRILMERTIGEQSSCRLEGLMTADVPPGIRDFFAAEVRHRVMKDLDKSPWLTGIRQSTTGSARVAQALVMSLTNAYQFTRQDFLDTLDLSVHFLANYLCRPEWTLENFLFDRSSTISRSALSEGLGYIADYRYLGNLVVRSLEQREKSEITRDEFQTLVQKIDDEVIRQHNARELAALMRPLFRFFQIPRTHPEGAIPIEALLVFFDDKRMRVLKEYIRGICHLRNRTHVTLQELSQLMEDQFAGRAPASAPTSSPPVEEPPAPSVGTPPGEAETKSSVPPARERTTPAGEPIKPNIALSLTFAGMQESLVPRQTLPEIGSLINPEQRDRFVTHIFSGDAAHYAGALVMLDSLKTWHEAGTYLGELFQTHNLDPHSGDAVEFTDTIRRRYAIAERVP